MTTIFKAFMAAASLGAGSPPPTPKGAATPVRTIDTKCPPFIAGIGLSPDDKHLFCFDHWTVNRIDLESGKMLPLPEKLRGEKIYRGVHVEKDVWLLALNRADFEIREDGYEMRFVLFDFATETIKADWVGHKELATHLAVARKQNWFVTAGSWHRDQVVCFWDAATQEKVREIDLVKELALKPKPKKGSSIKVERMAIDPSASFLAFGFFEGMIQVLDLEKQSWHLV